MSRVDNRVMGIGTRLIACPSCSCHAFARETVCPNCGASLRAPDGAVPRTAGAVMLGLSLVTATISACSDDTKTSGSSNSGGMGGVMVGSTTISAYGVASTSTGDPVGGMGGVGGTGGSGGKGGAGGAGGSGPDAGP